MATIVIQSYIQYKPVMNAATHKEKKCVTSVCTKAIHLLSYQNKKIML